jgi:hypothetical protein
MPGERLLMADDHDDNSDLTDREKELKKWNRPYVYQEFPKMLYRGTIIGGRIDVEQCTVKTAAEETLAKAKGWVTNPQTADDAANRALQEQQDFARQADDRQQEERIERAISRVLDRREKAFTESRETTDALETSQAGFRLARGFGRTLQAFMDECGWKFSDLERETKIDGKTISRHLYGGARPSQSNLCKYAEAFSRKLARTITPEELRRWWSTHRPIV